MSMRHYFDRGRLETTGVQFAIAAQPASAPCRRANSMTVFAEMCMSQSIRVCCHVAMLLWRRDNLQMHSFGRHWSSMLDHWHRRVNEYNALRQLKKLGQAHRDCSEMTHSHVTVQLIPSKARGTIVYSVHEPRSHSG